MPDLDKRLTPARPDLAADFLRGLVEADAFVTPTFYSVVEPVVDLRNFPNPDAGVDTQALFGEEVLVFEEEEGWAWVQLKRDSYVGYMSMNALAPVGEALTHRVAVPRTFLYPTANMKRPNLGALPLDARVRVVAMEGAFARLANECFIWAAHLIPLDQRGQGDFVSLAESLINAPYLWGGKSPLGIDCSGLVQLSMQAAGRKAPRDTDMQEKAIGEALPVTDDLAHLQRGDLIFWKGHVGIMQSATQLLHANGHHMQVRSEPLVEARARILAHSYGAITSIRRPFSDESHVG